MQTNIQTLATAISTIKRLHVDAERGHARQSIIDAWEDLRDAIMRDAPSGAGIDCGTTLAMEKCSADKIVLATSFHHMNDVGTSVAAKDEQEARAIALERADELVWSTDFDNYSDAEVEDVALIDGSAEA